MSLDSDSDTSYSSAEQPEECRVCKSTTGSSNLLSRFYHAGAYGSDFVGNDETDYVHYDCADANRGCKSEWAVLSVAQAKKNYGMFYITIDELNGSFYLFSRMLACIYWLDSRDSTQNFITCDIMI